MNKKMDKPMPFYVRATYALLFVLLLGFILQIGASILIPLTFSVLFSFIIRPLSIWLEKYRLPRWLAATVGIVLLMGLVIGILSFLSVQTAQITNDSTAMKAKISSKATELQRYIGQQFNFSVSKQNDWLDKQVQGLASSAGDYVMTFFSTTTTFLANAFLVPLLMFFLLMYRDRFKTFLLMFDEQTHARSLAIIQKIGTLSQQYIRGLFLEMLIVAVLMWLGFAAIGLPYALFLGILVAILNIIPYVGGIVGSLIAVLLAIVTTDGNWVALAALGVCLVVQLLDNNFISVKVVGSSVNLNPLVSTIALLVGALIWGVSGMLLSLPLMGMLNVVFEEFAHLRPYAFLLGEDTDFKHKPFRIQRDALPNLQQLITRYQQNRADNEPIDPSV